MILISTKPCLELSCTITPSKAIDFDDRHVELTWFTRAMGYTKLVVCSQLCYLQSVIDSVSHTTFTVMQGSAEFEQETKTRSYFRRYHAVAVRLGSQKYQI